MIPCHILAMKLETALTYFGNKRKIADALGVSRSALNRWKRGKDIPELRAYQLEEIMARRARELQAQAASDADVEQATS